jgi:hypothetical protein
MDSHEIVIHSSEKETSDPREVRGLVFEVDKCENVSSWIEALTPNADMPVDSELSPMLTKRTI